MVHEEKRIRRLNNQSNRRTAEKPTKKLQLKDPEEVKGFMANKKCTNSFKETLVETYDILIRSINQQWDKPFYARYDKLPKIPTEEKISMLISNASTRMALFLSRVFIASIDRSPLSKSPFPSQTWKLSILFVTPIDLLMCDFFGLPRLLRFFFLALPTTPNFV
jgi:hypothetical protein